MVQPVLNILPQRRQTTVSTVANPLFSGSTRLGRPKTTADSFERESAVRLNGPNLLADCVARMDEAMTVTGEKYAGAEAFTTQFHMKLTPLGQAALKKGNTIFGRIDRQVDWTKKFFMVMSGAITDAVTDTKLAEVRSTFCAVDPESVKTGNNKPVELPAQITPDTDDKEEIAGHKRAGDWNSGLMGALGLARTRLLGDKTTIVLPTDVKELPVHDMRATDDNFYVPTDMINKKQTGHGGVSVAKALEGMQVLAARTFGKKLLKNITLTEFSAAYLEPFVVEHALQADTTVDHVDKDGNIYMSTRLYRCDTKGLLAADKAKLSAKEQAEDGPILSGPVTIIQACLKAAAPSRVMPGGKNAETIFHELKGALSDDARAEADARQREAIAWSKVPF